MSTDWFLCSPAKQREVMVGSNGFSGVRSFPASPDVIDFIRWAIDENVKDIILIDEHNLHDMQNATLPNTQTGKGEG